MTGRHAETIVVVLAVKRFLRIPLGLQEERLILDRTGIDSVANGQGFKVETRSQYFQFQTLATVVCRVLAVNVVGVAVWSIKPAAVRSLKLPDTALGLILEVTIGAAGGIVSVRFPD